MTPASVDEAFVGDDTVRQPQPSPSTPPSAPPPPDVDAPLDVLIAAPVVFPPLDVAPLDVLMAAPVDDVAGGTTVSQSPSELCSAPRSFGAERARAQ